MANAVIMVGTCMLHQMSDYKRERPTDIHFTEPSLVSYVRVQHVWSEVGKGRRLDLVSVKEDICAG